MNRAWLKDHTRWCKKLASSYKPHTDTELRKMGRKKRLVAEEVDRFTKNTLVLTKRVNRALRRGNK